MHENADSQLPGRYDEQAIRSEAARHGIRMSTMLDYRTEAGGEPTTLMLGYGHMPEPAMVPGAREVAKAVRATA